MMLRLLRFSAGEPGAQVAIQADANASRPRRIKKAGHFTGPPNVYLGLLLIVNQTDRNFSRSSLPPI